MKKYLVLLLLFFVLGSATYFTHAQNEKRIPVIVELFTSEGCDTCPPADKYLQMLAKDQPIDGVEIVPLQEHVDYWNRRGWIDPFSSAQFSSRQQYYAKFFNLSEVFTPQLIADGTRQLTGKTGSTPIAEAAKLPKGKIEIKMEKDSAQLLPFKVIISDLPASGTEKTILIVAVTENDLLSKVSAGENKGSTFRHMAVTRYLKAIAEVKDKDAAFLTEIPLDSSWKRSNLNVVAFVQAADSRRILAVGKMSLKR